MSLNLITSGAIDPSKFSSQKLLVEVAKFLNISPSRIDRLESWSYQIWVNIQGVGGKFVSYRCSTQWLKAGIEAINSCTTLEQIKELGNVLATDTQKYGKQYRPNAKQYLHQIWVKKLYQLEAEAQRLKAAIARQQAAQEWLMTWRYFLQYCQNPETLNYLTKEIRQQSHKYADFPDIIEEIEDLWEQRHEELNQIPVSE